jgi:hypothetical protein
MSSAFSSATFVREFVQMAGSKLEHLPSPYDFSVAVVDNAKVKLQARIFGKLERLQTTEQAIAARFARQQGNWTQTCISRKHYKTTAYDAGSRELDILEENERSDARERWFCDLPDDDKAAFDQRCLILASAVFESEILEPLPLCLHGAIARLGFDAAEIAHTYKNVRSRIRQSVCDRGLTNPTVTSSLFNRIDEDEKTAISRLMGSWLRTLTPDQGAACHNEKLESRSDSTAGQEINAARKSYRDLLEFAEKELKGNQQRVVELLCNEGGKVPLSDLGVKFEWSDPICTSKGWDNLKAALNAKIKKRKLPYLFRRHDNHAVLERTKDTSANSLKAPEK